MYTFSPGTKAKSTEVNQNFTDLSTGVGDVDDNKMGLFRQETMVDYVQSGIVWSIVSGLNCSMSAGIAYISDGTYRKRIPITAVASKTFTASKDTYIDVGSDGVVYYTEVANGAASPALSANRIRVGLVISGASTITSIQQASFDSLGNIFKNVDPYGVTKVFFPTYQNGWVDFGAPWAKPCYFKDKTGTVYLRGLTKNGTVGVTTPIFTLPAGFRPYTNQQLRFACISNNALGAVNVYSNGEVNLEVGSNAYLFLDVVRFKAEQ